VTKTAVIAGATGAVGQKLLPLLLAAPDYARLKVLVRRPLPEEQSQSRLEVLQTDFSQPEALGEQLAADDVYCCLGTTQRQAGRAGLAEVDHQYVVNLARACRAQGAQQFLVVSAVGASEHSPSWYSRVKGRMEKDVSALGYASVHILRPSLLLGERQDKRPAEDLAQKLSPLLRPLFAGPLARYRPVPTEDVAGAMLQLSRRPYAGVEIHHLPLKD